jgi:hypothetical protein
MGRALRRNDGPSSSLPSAQLRTGAGTHNHRLALLKKTVDQRTQEFPPRSMGPCVRRDDERILPPTDCELICFARKRNLGARLRQSNTTGKSVKTCPVLRAKIFRFRRRPNHPHNSARLTLGRNAPRDRWIASLRSQRRRREPGSDPPGNDPRPPLIFSPHAHFPFASKPIMVPARFAFGEI